jgi:hypothetical protein
MVSMPIALMNNWTSYAMEKRLVMANDSLLPALQKVLHAATRVRENIARVLIGKQDVIDLLLVTLLSNGHVLLEDVPGMGKTVLAKALASSLDATFQRIQGTPDLLPTDITGVSYFDQKQLTFLFREGPLFTQILLVDEINRTTPRTQAALLSNASVDLCPSPFWSSPHRIRSNSKVRSLYPKLSLTAFFYVCRWAIQMRMKNNISSSASNRMSL